MRTDGHEWDKLYVPGGGSASFPYFSPEMYEDNRTVPVVEGRQVFRQELAPDDATWARARALELCHAVDAVLIFLPERHAVGDVMAATLERILADT